MKQVEMGRGGVMFDGLKSACACDTDRKTGRWPDGKDHGDL